MNHEWSLSELYQGYDDPKFAADMAKLDGCIAEFTEFTAKLTGDPAQVLHRGVELLKKMNETVDLLELLQLLQNYHL